MVIPTHNRLHLLRTVLARLDDQEGVLAEEYEVIVVADGDDTVAPGLADLRTSYRLTVLSQPQSGVAAARNRGWRGAAADHVLFIDDDMLATPRLVAAHLAVHETNPEAAVLGRFSMPPGTRPKAWTAYLQAVQCRRYRRYESSELIGGVRCYSGNLAIPIRLLERTGGFDTTLRLAEDVDLGFRLNRAGGAFVFAPDAETYHVGPTTLRGWLREAYGYGVQNIELYQVRGYGGGIDSVLGHFNDLHPLTRAAVRAALTSRALMAVVVAGGVASGIALHAARARGLSYAALSAAANSVHYAGSRDALGGNEPFWATVRRGAASGVRPYRQLREDGT